MNPLNPKYTALLVVDMQKYYLDADSDFCRYSEQLNPGSTKYVGERAKCVVIPSIENLIAAARSRGMRIIYLCLCSQKADRTDLHRSFYDSWAEGNAMGLGNVYPLKGDSAGDVVDRLKPEADDRVIYKTTFSPFNSTDIDDQLRELGIRRLIVTGLATSQCVDTTARDASDRGYEVIRVEDAMADYAETIHFASLYAGIPVCGVPVKAEIVVEAIRAKTS